MKEQNKKVEFIEFPGYKKSIDNNKKYRILLIIISIIVLLLITYLSAVLNNFIVN